MSRATGKPVTFYLRVEVTMTPDEEQAYRAERGLSPDESTRKDLAARTEEQLDGEGTLTGWWSAVRVR